MLCPICLEYDSEGEQASLTMELNLTQHIIGTHMEPIVAGMHRGWTFRWNCWCGQEFSDQKEVDEGSFHHHIFHEVGIARLRTHIHDNAARWLPAALEGE